MKTFLFGATVLDPRGLTPDVRQSFRTALKAAGASDLRVDEDKEGRATVQFRLEAPSEREALKRGSDITLAALESHTAVRWVASGVTHWQDE